MNDHELRSIWKTYDERLESALAVNRANTVEITRLKVSSQLASLKPIKLFAIAVGVVWCFALMGVFAMSLMHRPSHWPFIFFMAGLTGLNLIGVAMHIHHLVLIDRIDNNEQVLPAQRELAKLRVSTLNATRVLILTIPFYCSLHLFLANGASALFWVINGLILGSLVALTLWLFFKMDYRNHEQSWFKFLFNDREFSGVVKSIEILEQIEGFETAEG